jgi:hypothetical protein
MSEEEIEEVILALKAAGMQMPEYEILQDGSYHFFQNGQAKLNTTVHSQEPRSPIN